MPKDVPAGCGAPPAKPSQAKTAASAEATPSQPATNGGATMIKVGQPAPDFEANAFFNGGFTKVKLSEHLGKWVVLCFYPGDFTFV